MLELTALLDPTLPRDARLLVHVAHHTPGRLRVKVPLLTCERSAMARLETITCGLPGVASAVANTFNGSFVVVYDPTVIALAPLLEALESLTVRDLEAVRLQTTALVGAPEAGTLTKPWWQHHWVVAALALGIAATAGPYAPVAWLLLAVPAVPVFQRAWYVLTRERRLNVDFLDAAAIVASLAMGDVLNASLMVLLIAAGDAISSSSCRTPPS